MVWLVELFSFASSSYIIPYIKKSLNVAKMEVVL